MRSWIIAACIAGQIAVLAYLVLGRELVIQRGTEISIATAPIDPRDPFRGDFVRLRYPLNALSHAPVRWQPADYQPSKGDKMYAVLEQRPGGLYDVAYFSNLPPAAETQSLYLRGRIQAPVSWSGRNQVAVGFGIEQLFVEQGSGVDIEQRRGIRGGMQNAIHARIAVGADGSAVLVGYTWSDIAIGLEVTEAFRLAASTAAETVEAVNSNIEAPVSGTEQQASEADARPTPSIRVTVTNVSQNNLTLNNPGNNCGFRLEPLTRSNSEYFRPESVCTDLPIKPVTLTAGESMILDIDLADPRWHMSRRVNDEIQTADIRSFQDSREWYRLVYRSELQADALAAGDADTLADADADVDAESNANSDTVRDADGDDAASSVDLGNDAGATLFWQGDLVSQAFNPFGQTD